MMIQRAPTDSNNAQKKRGKKKGLGTDPIGQDTASFGDMYKMTDWAGLLKRPDKYVNGVTRAYLSCLR